MDVNAVKADSLPKEENGVLHQENGIGGGSLKFGSHDSVEPKAKDGNNIIQTKASDGNDVLQTEANDGNNALQTNYPRDAIDEWPTVHSFYFVKYRQYTDPKLKAKLEKVDADIQNKNKLRSQIFDKIRAKKSLRAELNAQAKPLREERKVMWELLKDKANEIRPLNAALGQLRSKNGGPREKGVFIFSSEQELNNHIKSLEYRIQHESIPLPEEKQILREIKQLEATRSKVAANAASRAQIESSMGEKGALQDQVNLIGVDLEAVKKDKAAIDAKLKPLDDQCQALTEEINKLDVELKAATENQQAALGNRNEVEQQGHQGNDPYYQNRSVLAKAKFLAAEKKIVAVKELENSEVEKFMSSWNSDKAFRDDYEKRILSSLDFRQLSRDGRIRNQGEELLVPPTPSYTSTVVTVKANVKQPKENLVQVFDKPQKEDTAVLTKENKKKDTDVEEEEIIAGSVKKDSQPKQKEVDAVKLKEMKREEELLKAKQALERKKKLAEKAAAKAAIKAQKEAEKKLKEREKKAKKKAAASVSAPEPEEPSADEETEATAEEVEKVEEDVKPPVQSKSKPRKENPARLRTKPRGGPEALPRAILKRKRSASYWVWGVPAAAVAAGLVVLAVGYTYFI